MQDFIYRRVMTGFKQYHFSLDRGEKYLKHSLFLPVFKLLNLKNIYLMLRYMWIYRRIFKIYCVDRVKNNKDLIRI